MTFMDISPHLAVGFGMLGMFATTQYIIWGRMRAILFRQKLFQIRDSLWDRMYEMGTLGDPAYREMRALINSCILVAPGLTVPMLMIVGRREHPAYAQPIRSQSAEVQTLLDQSREQMIQAIVTYAMRWHVSGHLHGMFGTHILQTGAQRVADGESRDPVIIRAVELSSAA